MPILTELTQTSQHGAWIEINLSHLASNLKEIKKHAGAQKNVMAVVKANAYGHGLSEIAEALAPKVQYLGVSSISEVLELKEKGIETPVFLFGKLLSAEITPAILSGAALCLSSFDEAHEISEAAQSQGKKVTAHIKVDTGMGRLGIPLCDALKEIQRIHSLQNLSLEGIFTHFPSADSDFDFTHAQVRNFILLLSDLEKKGITFPFRHGANSSGAIKIDSPAFNMIRPGIMLYGIYPDLSFKDSVSLLPVLSLKSRIISSKIIKAGESVGYGRSFVAAHATSIGILPIGYSHGYPWQLSGKAEVLYRGKRYKLAGRVSMDYLAVDFGDDSPRIGDEVTLLGRSGNEQVTAEDLARWTGTIPYEIITRLSPRIPRFYYSL